MDRRTMAIAAIAGVVLLAAIAGAVVALGGGGGTADARAALEAAGCTLSATPALRGEHTVTSPEGTSKKWNTDPPTSGPHYAVPAVWGSTTSPSTRPSSCTTSSTAASRSSTATASRPRSSRSSRASRRAPRGTVLAPYPKLGSKIALGAWVVPNPEDLDDLGTAYLAKCTAFDEKAFEAFFDAYQFKGPERFPADSLLPGRT